VYLGLLGSGKRVTFTQLCSLEDFCSRLAHQLLALGTRPHHTQRPRYDTALSPCLAYLSAYLYLMRHAQSLHLHVLWHFLAGWVRGVGCSLSLSLHPSLTIPRCTPGHMVHYPIVCGVAGTRGTQPRCPCVGALFVVAVCGVSSPYEWQLR
jgi:hypothetical protein